MEDHRDEICIIMAGYTNEMKKLIELNPGFESRIQFTINFPDYSETELLEIFNGLCKKEKYTLSKEGKELLIEHFRNAKRQENFGNGRYVRNIFEKIKFEQADRIVKSNTKASNSINMSDIRAVLDNENLSKQVKSRIIGFQKFCRKYLKLKKCCIINFEIVNKPNGKEGKIKMDVYNFINSNAISKHCREINYEFTILEIAVLIYRS